MAPLTWRNVDAPNFSGTAQSLAAASGFLNNATGELQEALARRSATGKQNASSALMLDVLKQRDPAAYNAALADGSLFGGLTGADVSPEAIEFAQGHANSLLMDENARLKNTGAGIYNNTQQFELDSARGEEARKAGYRANQPAANAAMLQARTDMDSGDPAVRARGRAAYNEASKLMTAAGIDAGAQLAGVDANTATYNEGVRTNQNTAANTDFFEERYRSRGQRGLLDALTTGPNRAIDSADAIAKLRQVPGLDAKTLENLSTELNSKADTYFPAPSALDTLGSRNTAPSQILNDYVANTPRAEKNTSQSGVPYVGYDNQAAKRNDPLDQNLVKAMDFLPAMGIEMRVFSGGQEDNEKNGTGSVRHNHGASGDVFFYRNGKKLDWNNPADQPIFQEITRQGLERGVTGFGAGSGYMQPGSMHIGFGNEAVWGKNGDGANAAPWLKSTYDKWVADGRPKSAGGSYSPSAMMQESVVRNGGVSDTTGVPVSTGPINTVAQNILGNTLGNPYDTRTTVNQVTPPADNTAAAPVSETATNRADDLSKFKTSTEDGRKVYTDDEGQKFVPAGQGKYTAVDDNGVPTGLDDYVPAGLTRPEEPAQTATNARQALTAQQIMTQAQTAANTAVVDNLSNQLGSAEAQLAARPNRGEDPATVATRLRGGKDAPGVLADMPRTAVTAAIRQIMEENDVDADVAGILAAQATESRNLAGNWIPFDGVPFFAGDAYGEATEGTSALRVDTNKAKQIMDQFRSRNNSTPGSVAPGVARLGAAQQQQQAGAQVQAVATAVAQVQDRVVRLQAAVQQNPTPENIALLQQAQARLEMLQVQLQQVNQSGALTTYTPNSLPQ